MAHNKNKSDDQIEATIVITPEQFADVIAARLTGDYTRGIVPLLIMAKERENDKTKKEVFDLLISELKTQEQERKST